jgi:hypothetical protein
LLLGYAALSAKQLRAAAVLLGKCLGAVAPISSATSRRRAT